MKGIGIINWEKIKAIGMGKIEPQPMRERNQGRKA